MKSFTTRTQARAFRSTVNAKAKAAGSNALLRDPVKAENGYWTFPGLNHGSKLSLKRS